MHDIPEEYLVSSVTFTHEAFQSFLAKKQFYLYQAKYSQILLDAWRPNPATYCNNFGWWEKDGHIIEGLLHTMKGERVFIAVYEAYPQLHFTLLEMEYEVFAIFANQLAVMLAEDGYATSYFLFNQKFDKVACYNDADHKIYSNFSFTENDIAIAPTTSTWKLLLNATEIAKLQQVAHEHESDLVSSMEIWFPLKEALIEHHRARNYRVLDKLYACFYALEEVTTYWPLWDIYDDMAILYYRSDPEDDWVDDIFKYLSHHQVCFGGLGAGTEPHR